MILEVIVFMITSILVSSIFGAFLGAIIVFSFLCYIDAYDDFIEIDYERGDENE